MHITIPKLSSADIAARGPAEGSAEVLARVVRARQAARERLGPLGISTNAQLRGRHLRHQLRLSPKVLGSLTRLLDRGDVTLRGCDRIQRVAWSLADLAGVGSPRIEDIDAAIGLRIGSGAKF